MGIDMTDLEMVKRCAEKMGFSQVGAAHGKIEVVSSGERFKPREDLMLERPFLYDPLTNDAQAMALGLSFPEQFEAAVCDWASMRRCGELNADLKRILCSFIARLP